MKLIPQKRTFDEALIDLEDSIVNLKSKKCIYNFSNYLYLNTAIDDTEKEYVKILMSNLHTFLETLIIKHFSNLQKDDIISLYIDLIIYEEYDTLKNWTEFDLESFIKKFYDEEEIYPLIKTYMKNCLIDLKNDYTLKLINDFNDQIDNMKSLIKDHSKDINELNNAREAAEKQREILEKSICKKDLFLSLKETTKNDYVQTDDPTEGHKTQISQTDGPGKEDIIIPTIDSKTDTSDLKISADMSTNTEKNTTDASVGDDTI